MDERANVNDIEKILIQAEESMKEKKE